jgi:hypothetical protein
MRPYDLAIEQVYADAFRAGIIPDLALDSWLSKLLKKPLKLIPAVAAAATGNFVGAATMVAGQVQGNRMESEARRQQEAAQAAANNPATLQAVTNDAIALLQQQGYTVNTQAERQVVQNEVKRSFDDLAKAVPGGMLTLGIGAAVLLILLVRR